MDIKKCRQEIDSIDHQILALVSQRAQLARTIGHLKKSLSLDIHDPHREEKILSALMEKNEGPLSDEAVKKIFRVIIEEHRSLELKDS